jgi:hypothetical protein
VRDDAAPTIDTGPTRQGGVRLDAAARVTAELGDARRAVGGGQTGAGAGAQRVQAQTQSVDAHAIGVVGGETGAGAAGSRAPAPRVSADVDARGLAGGQTGAMGGGNGAQATAARTLEELARAGFHIHVHHHRAADPSEG